MSQGKMTLKSFCAITRRLSRLSRAEQSGSNTWEVAWVNCAFKKVLSRIQLMAEFDWLKGVYLCSHNTNVKRFKATCLKTQCLSTSLLSSHSLSFLPLLSLPPSPFFSLPSFHLGSLSYFVFKRRGGQELF